MMNAPLKCLRVVCESDFEPGLVGLLGAKNDVQNRLVREANGFQLSVKTGADALMELENSLADVAVVTLDRLVEHTSRGEPTKVKILGLLLAGDVRGFAELQPTPNHSGLRILGSVHPEMALSRWEDLSCGLDINSEFDVSIKICPANIERELFSGRYGLMELNMHWEGLLGLRRGLIRRSVWAREFGLANGFSHVLVVNCDYLALHLDVVQALRERLACLYEAILAQTQKVAEAFAGENVFSRCPSASFLQASFRILAPHFEGFLNGSGKLEWNDLCPYVRWFQSRVSHRKLPEESPFTAIQLEHLLCDAWG